MTNIRGITKDPENTWLFSDPHFDHANIIKYCMRPFTYVGDMNFTLLRNYKKCVNSESLVFFLGDMAFGRDSRSPKFWLDQLYTVRRFVYLKGSHDHGIRPTNTPDYYDTATLVVRELEITLAHDYEILIPLNNWVIHGHNHDRRPFFDRAHKRINVSCDVTGFAPVQLSFILELIADKTTHLINTIPQMIQANDNAFQKFLQNNS